MINKGDTVRVIYRCPPQEDRFWKTGEVTLVETLDGTEVVFVRFSDGKTISFLESELQRIRRRANV